MKKLGCSAAAVSALALAAMSSNAYADPSSQEEIKALKAQLQEMAIQQQKAAAVIEKLSAKVDELQNQNSAQAAKVSDIQKQQVSQAAQTEKLAKMEPASGSISRSSGGAYAGIFGGAGSGSSVARQLGTVYFIEAAGGPQNINAKGKPKDDNTTVVGAQVGYEWSNSSYLRPAVELEALYLPRSKQRANMPHYDVRATENMFNDTLPTDTSVVLANAVLGFKTPYKSITPYIGGGVGAAYVTVTGATSTQLNPAEPGINHFNSEEDSSVLTAAGQLKAGIRMDLSESAYLFGEYRYLYIGAHDQTFGSTFDPGHSPTSPWTVSYDGTSYNLATLGLGVRF